MLAIAQHGDLDRLPDLGMEDQVAVQVGKAVDRPAVDVDDQVAALSGPGVRGDEAGLVARVARRHADDVRALGL